MGKYHDINVHCFSELTNLFEFFNTIEKAYIFIHSFEMHHVKCVVVGDTDSEKTKLLRAFTDKDENDTTVYDNYEKQMMVKDTAINLQLWDTAGQEEYAKLRPLSYPQTDVFVLCFSLASNKSMKCIEKIYLPEIKKHCPEAAYILVGTNSDLRDESSGEDSITTSQGEGFQKKIGAQAYVECSVSKKTNINEVFEAAILSLYEQSRNDKSKKKKGHKSCLIY